jgi:fatty-acyl-CoA synthase
MRDFEATFGSPIVQGYGLTETSPLVAIAEPPTDAADDEYWRYRTKTGRISPMVEARIVDGLGSELPWDSHSTGELELAGPWVASGYYLDDEATAEKMRDGWLRTGDIATIDDRGYLQITDRTRDVIKSGGEWISSVEMENHLMSHPAVREAAVIAKPDERWTERPIACVVLDQGARVEPAELNEHLSAHFARWQLPDEYAFVDEVPRTSVGKFDKKALRRRLAEGRLERREARAATDT